MNKPIVQVHADPDSPLPNMKAQFSSDLGEEPRSWSETERKSPELVNTVPPHKTEPLAVPRVDQDVEVGVLQVYGDSPIARVESISDGGSRLHAKLLMSQVTVEGRKIQHRAPSSCSLGYSKNPAVKPRSGAADDSLRGPLLKQGVDLGV